MEKNKSPLQIRVNNSRLVPFNPFPIKKKSLRNIEYKSKIFGDDNIRIEGFVLPSYSITEAKEENNVWTTKY